MGKARRTNKYSQEFFSSNLSMISFGLGCFNPVNSFCLGSQVGLPADREYSSLETCNMQNNLKYIKKLNRVLISSDPLNPSMCACC